jgi:predicted nucleotidyltransferase
MIELHPDFRDFLRLLNSKGVRYLLVGRYAVGCHGYPRATADMDVWVAVDKENAERACKAIWDFGIPKDQVSADPFLQKDKVIRMGVPPVRIKVITGASGVVFEECYRDRKTVEVEGVRVDVIGLDALKKNKKACGRLKDLEDILHLP